MIFRELAAKISREIDHVLLGIREESVIELVQTILKSDSVVVHGAGRVGLACRGFAMRLGHLGLQAFSVTDAALPPVGEGQLLIIASSSGETQTVYDVALAGKKNGVRVAVITANHNSRIAQAGDQVITLHAPTKFGPTDGAESIQPMATLFEQCLQILFDAIVLILMREMNQTHAEMWKRHTNLD